MLASSTDWPVVAVLGPEVSSSGEGRLTRLLRTSACLPKQFQAPNHGPGPGVPVSKVAGNARPNSSASPLLLVPQSLQGLTGTPLVAGSPIRHESAVQGSAVEVQTYQPPWKALSEFALQSDLDQPAFQQLVRTCSTRPDGWTPGEVGWI